ncbi:MAG: thioredoxin family protein, partial [Candidatus Fimenecus sp.]
MSVIKVNLENFSQEVLKSDKPVLLDFYADWC